MAKLRRGDVVVHVYKRDKSPCNGLLAVVTKFQAGLLRGHNFEDDDGVWVQIIGGPCAKVYTEDTPWTAAAWECVGHIELPEDEADGSGDAAIQEG